MSNSSSVSKPSARNAGETTTTSRSLFAKSSTTDRVEGFSHFAGPSLLWKLIDQASSDNPNSSTTDFAVILQ